MSLLWPTIKRIDQCFATSASQKSLGVSRDVMEKVLRHYKILRKFAFIPRNTAENCFRQLAVLE